MDGEACEDEREWREFSGTLLTQWLSCSGQKGRDMYTLPRTGL